MDGPSLVSYKTNRPSSTEGQVSATEVKVDRDMAQVEMNYSPVQTDSEESPNHVSKSLPPVEVVGSGPTGPGKNGKVADMKNGDTKGIESNSKNGSTSGDEGKKEEVKMVGTCELFRFATCLDAFMMFVGSLAASIHGAALPCMIIVFGDMVDSFVNFGVIQNILIAENKTLDYLQNDTLASELLAKYNMTWTGFPDILGSMKEFAIYYIIIACGVMVFAYLQVTMWAMAAERQTFQVRKKFFHNILRQEIGWFDTHESGELNTRLADDVNKIRDGIGDKMGSFFQWFAGGVAGFVIGFVYGWKLTLVILAVSPALVIAAFVMTKLATSMTSLELKAYAKAGAVAEEVLGAIRTVVAFGGQDKECERYNGNLISARDTGVKKGLTSGLGMGFIWLAVFGSYALGFWYGSKLVREDDNYTSGNVLIVFFSVIIAAFSLGNAAPSLQALASGRGAAYAVFAMIDQEPEIDSFSDAGKMPEGVQGNVEFRNVRFTYPSRKEVQVLNGLSLKVAVGQTVALVGSSGCGKSTTVQLLQRFYDTTEGEVLLDGMDIRMLNVKWLRRHIGVVSQEPVLFGTTISENIRYGRLDVTQEEIEAASKQANAHDFIMKLPQKYETLVGERGAQLSGGQKQRVAIARALVRDPKILLLDEATSALDTESESIVQEALEKASHGRTTIVIAHRLSTVRGADVIVGIKDGLVMERGTHDELMKIDDGLYNTLVTLQTKHLGEEDDELAMFEAEVEEPTSPKSIKTPARDLKRMLSSGSVKRSVSVTAEKEDKEEEEKLADPSMKRVMRMNATEWPYILIGCFAALCNGGIQPAFAILFAEILGVWSELDLEKQKRDVMLYSLLLLGLGVLSCFTMFLQGYMFGKSGEYLTMRLRKMAFKSMLRQEISWHDDHKNSTGALCTRLATDASQVQGATGARIGSIVQSIANMGTAMVIAFVYGWKLTLVILAFLPFIVVGGFLQMKILTGIGQDKEAHEGAGKVAAEAIEEIRTVAALTREETFYQHFVQKIAGPYKASIKKASVYGLAFGFSQAIIFFAYAASFYFGAYLVQQGEMTYEEVFKVFSAIVFGAMGLGQASAFAPDYAKAKVSATRMFLLFDQVPSIDSEGTDGAKPAEGQVSSKITFSNVKFNYPTRPDVIVLKGINISVNPGETVALVGSSGCGKSTSVSLIERFYDPLEGNVVLDKYDISTLNVQWLRQQVGIVSQEPVLFDSSIAENIAYGDNCRKVQMTEIIEAARKANIHSFIESLPNGYDTSCGDKGAQLSGGQKQRIAIARALVRNPKILLLDEATSALDTESEQVVQEALDRAREGRTCVVIAHRLSTIQNADRICVIHHGQVMEEGTHSELMSKQGFYYKLQMIQGRKKNN